MTEAAGRGRHRARRRATVLPRIALGLSAALALLAGGLGAQHYTRARSAASAAMRQWRVGHYAAAAGLLASAGRSWPWLAAARLEPQALALARSSRAFQRGATEMAAGAYSLAEGAFAAVLPADTHYAAAQRRLTTLRTALGAAHLARAADADASRFAADSQAFWGTYHVAMDDLVPAWEQYGFGNPAPYERAAATPVAELPSLAGRLSADALALSQVAACPEAPVDGSASAPAPARKGASQASPALAQASQYGQAAAAAALGIAHLGAESLSTLEGSAALTVSVKVPADISTLNGDAVTLRADQEQLTSWEARGAAFLGTEVSALLGPKGAGALLGGGGSAGGSAAPPAGTPPADPGATAAGASAPACTG